MVIVEACRYIFVLNQCEKSDHNQPLFFISSPDCFKGLFQILNLLKKILTFQASQNLELKRNKKRLMSFALNCTNVSELPITDFGFLDLLAFSIRSIIYVFFDGCLFSL